MAKGYDWETVRARWEAGASANSIATLPGMPSRQAIDKRAKKENWVRDLEPAIKRKVAEKVAGVATEVAERNPEKIAEVINEEAERRAAVERKHREEPQLIRNKLIKALTDHDNAKEPVDKTLAFADLKAAKISSEILKNIHELERKAWRLDVPDSAPEEAPPVNIAFYVKEPVGDIETTNANP